MGYASCTVLFDGRFWIALAEREGDDGTVSVARHVFGPEPTNTDLLRFYLHELGGLRFLAGADAPRAKIRKKPAEERRRVKKSLDAFEELRSSALTERKRETAAQRREADEARYEAKRQLKKSKRKGR
jgi:hypothetical protein